MIDVDLLIPQIDENKASKILETIKTIEDGTNEEVKSFQALYNTGDKTNQWIAEYAQSTKDQIRSTEGVINANQQARASALAHNEAIKAQTFSAKASKVAFQALAAAGNMLAMWAVTKGIELAVKGIDNLAHSAEHCKERVAELMSDYQSALDKANSNADTVESLSSRYEELSKGVNNLGENVSLAADEYSEYNDIVNQIAGMFPTLLQGYTSEGNAILSLKGNVEQLRDAYKDAQQEAYNMLISSGEDSDGNDIIENANNVINGNYDILGNKWASSSIEKKDAYQEFLDSIISRDFEQIKSIVQKYDVKGMNSNWLLDSIGIQWSDLYNIKGLVATEDELYSIQHQIQSQIQTNQAEIDLAVSNVQTLANAYLMTNKDYAALDEQSKNAASIIVNSINEDIASGFEDKIDVGEYVIKIVDTIKENPDVQDALIGLFTLDLSEKSITEAQSLIDIYTASIAKELDQDPLELKIRLGFADIDDVAGRLKNSIRQITDDHGQTDRGEYTYLMDEIDFDSFTQSQAELWLEATLGAENAAQAIEMYEAKLTELEPQAPLPTSDIFSLKDADNTLTGLGKISESIDTIQSACKTLSGAIDEYNENGSFSIDTLQSVIALGGDWLDYLVDEEGNLTLDRQSLEDLTRARLGDMRIQAINNVIDNISNIQDEASANEYLASTNYALADSYEAVAQAKLEDARSSMLKAVEAGDLSQQGMDKAMNKATADIAKINKLFDNTNIGPGSIMGGGGSGSGGSSSSSKFSETIDFFKQRVEVLDDALSHLDTTMDNVSGSFGKNNLVDAQLGINEEKFNNYTDALAMYTQKANEAFAKIPADIASKVKDGAVALTDFVGDGNKDVVEAIKDYQSWADEISGCKEELAKLQKEIRQLELEKFNNIMEDFQNQFDLRGDSKDLVSKQIDLRKEAGELIGESFFTAQIDQSKKQLNLLETEKAQLVNQMTSAVGSGRIQTGTDEWLEMVNALSDVDGSILDCKKSIESFDNSLLELHTEAFDRIQQQFSNLDSEISNILDLFDEFEISDEKGIWSKEGTTQLGLLTQQYELAQYRIRQYNSEIQELSKQYLAGKYSAAEYADKLASLSRDQWDAVKAAESAKDAIMDLNETRIENQIKGIEKEIDAYKELTDAQIEALKASKDLHEYENSIAEKTKSITDLQRQIAAMQNDNSAATVAKRKQLEDQLAQAKKDLEETEYQHSIEVQEDALNKQYEDYKQTRNDEIEALRVSLNDKETLLAQSFETVKANASTVGQEITWIAAQHGITVSNSLISSWQSGENAIASYGEVLSQGTSAFIGNIMGVENEVWNLQAQANITADSLAWMFSAKADSLVNELTASYYSEENLQIMTLALQDSLTGTLERGYDVSGIVNAIDSISGAAGRAKASIDALLGSLSKETSGGGGVVGNSMHEKVIFSPALRQYAGGTRSTRGPLFIKDEKGYELQLDRLSNGRYAIANEGSQIFTKEQTDNLYEQSKLSLASLARPIPSSHVAEQLWKNAGVHTPAINRTITNHTPVQIGNLLHVEGNVDSSNIRQMEVIADKAVNKLVNRLHDGIMYGK